MRQVYESFNCYYRSHIDIYDRARILDIFTNRLTRLGTRIMDIEVAVEKLNSMTSREILDEALALPVCHKTGEAKECLIANLLRHWSVEDPTAGSVHLHSRHGNRVDTVETPQHVGTIIYMFDTLTPEQFGRWYAQS